MVSDWPVYTEEFSFKAEEEEFERVMEVIRAIRNRRNEMNVPPSRKAKVYIVTNFEETFNNGAPYVCKLASASDVTVSKTEIEGVEDAVRVVTDSATVYMPMNELVDFKAELARLEKEIEAALKDKNFYESKLNNQGFVAKAPAAVVEKQRELLAKTLDRIALLEDSIAKISK